MANNKTIPTIKYIFFIGLGFFIMYLVFKNMDFEKMWRELSEAKYSWIFLSMALAIASHISRAYRWNILLKPIGYTPKIQNSIAAIFIAYFANILLPRFGEVARCTVLNRTDKIPIQTLVGTVIAERAFDLVCLIIILILTVFMNISLFGGFFYDNIFEPIGNKLAPLFQNSIISILVIIGTLAVFFFVLKNFKKFIPNKIKGFLFGILDGIKSINNIEEKGSFLFHTIFIWVMYFAMVYVCFFSLDFTNNLKVPEGFFLLIAGGLGMSAPVQGGIGAYHFMVREALLVLPDFLPNSTEEVRAESALIFATLVHTAQTILMFTVGGITLIWLFLKGIKLKNE